MLLGDRHGQTTSSTRALRRGTAILVASVLLAACGNEDSTTTEDQEVESDAGDQGVDSADLTFGFVLPDLSNPFISGMLDGAERAADEQGVNLVATGSDEPDGQVDAALNYIASGVDVLGINAIDSAAIASVVEQANDEGIPVIMIQAGTDSGETVTFVAANNVEGGELIGESTEEYCEAAGSTPCKVGIIEGNLADQSGVEEDTGFRNIVEPNENIEIVGNAPTNYDPSEALNVATNLMTANPDIDILYSWWGDGALAAIEAVRAAGREGEVGIMSFAGTCEVNQQVIDGTIYHNTMFFPEAMGSAFITSARAVIDGEELPEVTDAPIFGLSHPTARALLDGEMDPPPEVGELVMAALRQAEAGEC